MIQNNHISKILEKTLDSLNQGRSLGKKISLDHCSILTGENSLLDSIDLVMFIVEFEAQLEIQDINIDLMKISEESQNDNKEISLEELINR